MNDLINRIQRELPDTDKDRYDAAYDRGQAQAKSGLAAAGLAFGALLGAGLMYLFDPHHGAGRRSEFVSRAAGLRNDLARTATSKVEELQNRAKGATNGAADDTAIEPGYREPEEGVPAHATARTAEPRTKRSKGSNGTAVAGLGVDDAPGAGVPDPSKPEEIEQYGSSGPIAGAILTGPGATDDWEAAEREAQRASEGQAGI